MRVPSTGTAIGGAIVMVILTIALNLALLAGSIYVVIWVLQQTGVI